ncbi:M20/M25/M40 family metallo-hydrolase [Aggregatilineales bacterium SYSU G02658]
MIDYIQHLTDTLALNNYLPELASWALEECIRIQQIPAPTFAEAERAAHVAEQFRVLGLADVETDDLHNVTAALKGEKSGAGILIMAHTDTVFPATTDLTITYPTPDTVAGPGIGDNSVGVAGLLALARYFQQSERRPACDIWFAATSCEEGLGDLKGVRAVYERLADRIGAVINIEGMALGHVYHAGIASHRLRLQVTTEGGHSWLHFGRPSAIHALIEIAHRLIQLSVPSVPRTTFNIGIIEGGQSINTIAASASLLLDLRSESQDELERLKRQVQSLLQPVPAETSLSVEIVGDRPTGSMPVRHSLVKGALQALREVGIEGTLESGSTDGNIPLYHGCPCVTIGITRGGNAHRFDEFIHVPPIAQGIQQLITLTLATAQAQADRQIEGL